MATKETTYDETQIAEKLKALPGWYFEDGVDANKITVPELRSILLRHGVTYPSSAKKPVLVGLFKDVVLPQKSQVQRAQAHTKRSTRGIVDVPSSSASTVDTVDTESHLEVSPIQQCLFVFVCL